MGTSQSEWHFVERPAEQLRACQRWRYPNEGHKVDRYPTAIELEDDDWMRVVLLGAQGKREVVRLLRTETIMVRVRREGA